MDYEILIRGKNGAYAGGHRQATPRDLPEPITLAQWPEVCASINTATLAALEDRTAQLEAVKAELDAYKKRGLDTANYVVKVVDDPSISPEQTGILCKQAALGVMANEIERQRQALLTQQAEIASKLEAISAL